MPSSQDHRTPLIQASFPLPAALGCWGTSKLRQHVVGWRWVAPCPPQGSTRGQYHVPPLDASPQRGRKAAPAHLYTNHGSDCPTTCPASPAQGLSRPCCSIKAEGPGCRGPASPDAPVPGGTGPNPRDVGTKPALHNGTAHLLLHKNLFPATPKRRLHPASPRDGAAKLSTAHSIPYSSSLPIFIPYIYLYHLGKPFVFLLRNAIFFPWQRELRAWCQVKCTIQRFSWWHRVPQLPLSLCRGKYQKQESKRSKSAGSHPQDHFPPQLNAKVQLGRELLFQSSAQLRIFFQPPLVVGTQMGIFPAGIKLAYHLASNLLDCGLDQHGFTISNTVKGYFAIEFSRSWLPSCITILFIS